jgi:DNA-binding NarL/FixJ family response regulator
MIHLDKVKLVYHQCSKAEPDQPHLQQMVGNALQQIEIIRAVVNRIACPADPAGVAVFSSKSDRQSVTKREREVLNLAIGGYSNKRAALMMRISHRNFENHRAKNYAKAWGAQLG